MWNQPNIEVSFYIYSLKTVQENPWQGQLSMTQWTADSQISFLQKSLTTNNDLMKFTDCPDAVFSIILPSSNTNSHR
jgi:hypothetical protein